MNRIKTISAAALVLLLAAACGSTGGGLGDIFGSNSNRSYDIRGTVDSVDLNSRSIYLTNVTGYTNGLASGVNNTARVFYDDRTTVQYQGRTYRPADLERGDQVSVRADQNGNQLLAQSMDVTYNAGGGMASSTSGTNTSSSIRGTVRYIDPSTRTIVIENPTWMTRFQTGTGGNTMTIHYDPNFQVDYQGQQYPVTNLEPGDVVDVQLQNSSSTYYTAQRITVVRNVNAR